MGGGRAHRGSTANYERYNRVMDPEDRRRSRKRGAKADKKKSKRAKVRKRGGFRQRKWEE